MDCEPNLATILLKNIQAGIIVIDASNKLIVDVNPAACVLLGAQRDDILGTLCFKWFCSDGTKCPIIDSVDEYGVPIVDIDKEETEVRRPDGTRIVVLRSAVSVLLDSRRHIIVTITDISVQKETEKNYSDLVKYAPAGIYEIDLEHQKFTSVNDLMLKYTEYTREEFLNTSPFDLLDGNSQLVFLDRLSKMSRGESVDPEVEYKIRTKSGGHYWILLRARYIYKNGIPTKAFCIATDITERRKARIDLMVAKDEAQMYLDMAFNMFVSLDVEGKIRLINRTGCDILGIDECFLMGQPWFNFIPDEDKDKTQELFRKLITGEYDGTVTNFENHVLNSKGEKRLIAWKNRVIRDTQGNIIGTFSSGDDVTDQRMAEQITKEMWDKVDVKLTEGLQVLKSGSIPKLKFNNGLKRFELEETLSSLVVGRV